MDEEDADSSKGKFRGAPRASLTMRPSINLNPAALGIALEKFKADAASVAGSMSSMRSRRLSASSQVSYTSKRSAKSGRSTRGGRGVRRGIKGADNAEPEVIQVFDENGKEVTPKPLVALRPTILHERLLQAPPERFSPDSDRFSTFSRTGYSISSSLGTLTPELEGEDSEREPVEVNRRASLTAAPPPPILVAPRVEIVKSSIAPPPVGQELERTIMINLKESPTFVLINLRGDSVSNTYENIKQVLERNARYKKLLEAKVGSDNYTDSSGQTTLSLQKSKETQFFAQVKQSEECQANSWDISDCYAGHVSEEKVDPLKPSKEEEEGVEGEGEGQGDESDQSDHRKSIADLVSAGYLEEATDPPPMQPGGRRMSGNLQGSRRGSLLGGMMGRRDSGAGSMVPSRRGSGVESVSASRRGSTTASVSASRRGSLTAASRRGSLTNAEKASISGSIMFNRRLSGQQTRRSSIISNTMQKSGAQGIGGEELMSLTVHATRRVDINRISGLVKALDIVERALVQNTFHDKLLFYRDFKSREQQLIKGTSSSSTPQRPTSTISASSDLQCCEQVSWLWDFQCDLTEGRNVSCMVWNKASKDLLTVGYGEFEFGSQKGGLIAFWSLKNPKYPHATIPTASDVTALDFSTNSPNLLAVGFYDGNVAVYDAKNYKDRDPLMQSGTSSGKHNDPVWKLQWIDASSDHGETLISISTDGRVSQWSLKKDLEFVNLMRLKKIPMHNKGAQPQPFISRHAAGLCFDFSPRDPSLYLVGTEEGLIHKCSRSYNEQYLQTYVGHTGPVFQVRWSTVLPYIFISCSSDWSVRLWREEQESALLVFQTANESVGDVRWSCKHSCVFGTVSDDGRMEIWDMAMTAMKPVIVHSFTNTRLSCLLFSEEAPIVLAGGSTGAVSVLRLVGFDAVESEIDELIKLKKSIVSNVNTILD